MRLKARLNKLEQKAATGGSIQVWLGSLDEDAWTFEGETLTRAELDKRQRASGGLVVDLSARPTRET